MSYYWASQCLNESSIRLYYTNKETNEGSSASAKACRSCKEEVGAIIQHCAKTQHTHKPNCARTWAIIQHCAKTQRTHKPSCARTWAIGQHHETRHCKRRARGARTRDGTTSCSKRYARCARTRDRTMSHCKRSARRARTRDRTTSHCKSGARCARTRDRTSSSSQIGPSGASTWVKTTGSGTGKENLWDGVQVGKWEVSISSALWLMEWTLCSRLWVHSSFEFDTWD